MRIKTRGIEAVLAIFGRAETVPDRQAGLSGRVDRLRRDFAMGTHANIARRTPVGRPSIFGATVDFVNIAHRAPCEEFDAGRKGKADFRSLVPEIERDIPYALCWPGMEGMPFMRPAVAERTDGPKPKLDAVGKGVAG